MNKHFIIIKDSKEYHEGDIEILAVKHSPDEALSVFQKTLVAAKEKAENNDWAVIQETENSFTAECEEEWSGNYIKLYIQEIEECQAGCINQVGCIKATEIDDITIHKAHCDWIVNQAMELKALFSHNSEKMVELNKSRALADIETMTHSLSELKLYVESLD